MTDENIHRNLKKVSTWKRILFMLIFAVIVGIVRILLWAVVLLQVASALFTGAPNPNLLKLGRTLAVYLYQILLFLTYNREEMPFPFSEWNPIEEDFADPENRKLKSD